MYKFILVALELASGSLSGEPELHPRVTFPVTLTKAEWQEELYGECDRAFAARATYKRAVIDPPEEDAFPIGMFGRDWLSEEIEIERKPPGHVIFVLKVISQSVDNLKSKIEILYQTTLTPFHRELLQILFQTYSSANQAGRQASHLYQDLNRYLFGRFQVLQGQYISTLERFDYLRALRLSSRMADNSFDRLRGYHPRLRAVMEATLLTEPDKNSIQGVMAKFLGESEQELIFWWNQSSMLRVLYDLMYYIADNIRVLEYRKETGGATSNFIVNYNIEMLNLLKLKLHASFHRETCQQGRKPGRLTRAMEFALALILPKETDDEKPEEFSHIVRRVTEKIAKDYDSLSAYREIPPPPEEKTPTDMLAKEISPPSSVADRLSQFLTAIAKNHFFMADQLALNGILNKEAYPWQDERPRLNDNRDLVRALIEIQDQLYFWKFHIALRLKEESDDKLRQQFNDLFNKFDEGEFRTYQARLKLNNAYKKEIQNALNSQAGFVGNIKQKFIDGAKSYFLTGEIFDKTPPYSVAVTDIRNKIRTFTGYIREAESLFPGKNGSVLHAPRMPTDMALIIAKSAQAGKSAAQLSTTPLISIVPAASRASAKVPRVSASSVVTASVPPSILGSAPSLFPAFVISRPSPAPTSSPALGPSSSPLRSSSSATEASSLGTLDRINLQTYQRFHTPETCCDFVLSPVFEENAAIDPAIIYCGENSKAVDKSWDWKHKQEMLIKYKSILQTLNAPSEGLKGYFLALQSDLLASIRRGVVTAYSEYKSSLSPSWLGWETYRNKLDLLVKSGRRKLGRASEFKSPINNADDFRDLKFHIIFEERIKWGRRSQTMPSGEKELRDDAEMPILPTDLRMAAFGKTIIPKQKIFKSLDLLNYVNSYKFEEEPHIALIIINYHEQSDLAASTPYWEAQENLVFRFLELMGSRDLLIAQDEIMPEKNLLLESFRKKILTEYNDYASTTAPTYLALGSLKMSSYLSSAWRKGARILQLQSPLSSAGDFDDPAFQAQFEKKIVTKKVAKKDVGEGEKEKKD